jgi:hypothetical protein
MKLLTVILILNFTSVAFSLSDVSWTFNNTGTTSYILETFEPNDIGLGPLGAEDPTLTLHVGKRYQVSVINFGPHPFEVISKGSTSTSDVVLLSMKTTLTGSFESDPDVDWINDAAGTVTFTLTPSLATAMVGGSVHSAGYRCGLHVSSMRGDFVLCMSDILGDLNEDCVVNLTDFSLVALNWLFCDFEPQSACP